MKDENYTNQEKYEPPYNRMAREIKVIETTIAIIGSGDSNKDPLRRLIQYWTKEGKLIAEVDEWKRDKPQQSSLD